MRPVQLSLFTPGGQIYTEETMARELRAEICRHLSNIFRSATVDVACPDCGRGLRVLLHPSEPAAWCECGFVLDLRHDGEAGGGS